MTRVPVSHAEFVRLMSDMSNWGRWGADDQRGTLNFITPERVRQAMGLVREGVSMSLSHSIADRSVLGQADSEYPAVHLMKTLGDSSTDYIALTVHGPYFTHLDALSHHAWEGRLYNGTPSSAVTIAGATSHGAGVMRDGVIGRGVLLDVVRALGVPWLEPGEGIGCEDLERAEAAQGTTVGEGDILIVSTGRERRRREVGPWTTRAQAAGFHPSCLPWIRDRRVALVALDGVQDAFPSVVEGTRAAVHALALTAMGLPLIDNIALEGLSEACASRRRWEFLVVISPLRIEQATGSPINPIAVF